MKQHFAIAGLCLLLFACAARAASTIDSLGTATFPFPDSGIPSTSKYNVWISQNGADKRATYQQIGAPYQGAAAPAAPFKYQLWWNTSTLVPQLEVYDGSQWQIVGALDATNHAWAPPVGGGTATLSTAATVDLGSVPEAAVTVNGAGTISSFGSSAAAGTLKFLTFNAAVTLTNNGTSLILPGQRNILTAAGDQLVAQYLGAGNWRVVVYEPLAPGGAVCTTSVGTPANPAEGQCWLNTSASPAQYEIYDGSTWVLTGYLDTTHHTWLPVVPSAGIFPENYGAVGDGSTDDAPALASACTAAAAASVPMIMRQKYALATNRTLSCNVAFMPAAYIAPAVATTTTITGWIHAGEMERIFQGAGAVSVTGSPYLSAQWWGVVNATGFTTSSADVALGRALTSCAAVGGTLSWPTGTIALTGTQTNTLKNCHVKGAGVMAGTAGQNGTLVTITSAVTAPFIIQSNWSIEGVNFFWPNQTGAVVYPPLFKDDGVAQANFWWLDHVSIVNAYDGIVETSGGTMSWGEIFISNSAMYAVHRLYDFANFGDGVHMANNHYTPSAWAGTCNCSTTAAINAADAVNELYHISNSGAGVVTMFEANSGTYGWKYGMKIDAGGLFANSKLDLEWDGIATLLDTSSGGTYSVQNRWLGSMALCGQPVVPGPTVTGNAACFNLGANGALVLDGFHNYGARGSFIKTAGASVYLRQVVVDGIGAAADGSDYYMLQTTAVGAGTELILDGGRYTGINASANVHGVSTGAFVAARIAVQNAHFEFLNEDLAVASASGSTVITGNWSASTHGTVSVAITGTNAVQYTGNVWDKPPVAGVSGCGTGASIVGAMAGVIQVGSTVPTTACTLTLPWVAYGDGSVNGACSFTPTIGPLSTLAIAGTPAAWTMSSGAVDMHGSQIYYNCPGQQ